MIINDRLLGDLFLESHQALAVESIRNLNSVKDFIIIKRSDLDYTIFKPINVIDCLIKENPYKNVFCFTFAIDGVNIDINGELYVSYKNKLLLCTIINSVEEHKDLTIIQGLHFQEK